MRTGFSVALVALAVWTMRPVPVDAWGFNGHRFITERALDLLPHAIRPFFQQYKTVLVEHSIDPDTYRTVGFTEEPPRHFLDMDAYGPFPFKDLPHDYTEAVAKRVAPELAAKWIINELPRALEDKPIGSVDPEQIALLLAAVADGTVAANAAKGVLGELVRTGGRFADVQTVAAPGGDLEPAIDAVIAANPEKAAQYKAGKTGLLGFFVGQVMKAAFSGFAAITASIAGSRSAAGAATV